MRRWSLRALSISIAVSAILAIWIILFGELTECQARILWASTCITLASLFISPCAMAWRTGRRDIAPPLGILASAVGFGMLALLPWIDVWSPCYVELAVCSVFAGFSLAHVSLLSLARVALRYRPLVGLAQLISLAFGGALIALIVWDLPPMWLDRAIIALAVALVASTALVAVLHRLNHDLDSD